MTEAERFDFVIVGSGPAGHAAAIIAARAGHSVAVIERDRGVGGACVQRGTIPSKTLRETAAYFAGLKARSCGALTAHIPPEVQLTTLMARMERVVEQHSALNANQFEQHGVVQIHGRASFTGPREVEVVGVRGGTRRLVGGTILVAVGSRPRTPPNVPVDHEHVLDSDSVLSAMYLPRSLAILGGGVIAAEYASIFAALGVEVAMIDRFPRPVGFLDQELTDRFVAHFEAHEGCRFLGDRKVAHVQWDGAAYVVTQLDNGEIIRADKMLCAQGRVGNIESLQVERAGLQANDRGLLDVDEHGRTAVPHIYACGDVIGAPALASSSREQGRRAVYHALGQACPNPPETTPIGIYTIPEMAAVGMTEEQARAAHGDVRVGRAKFSEIARGLISANTSGILKLVTKTDGTLLGAHVLGEGATEIIHLAQLALQAGLGVRAFADSVFNFPTLAEAYSVAADEIVREMAEPQLAAPATVG
ncbi:MAG: Si-specific NAD(P)(+) transhydrogenase [Planctomycetota bacterium]